MSKYQSVRVHPIFDRAMSYQEHFRGNLSALGDDLGRDCQVVSFDVNADLTNGFFMPFKNDGIRNEDWYSYNANVLAPISGVVTKIHVNPEENKPGSFEPSQASSIVIEGSEGLFVTVVHIKDIQVSKGQHVEAGQKIAQGGNNGCSRAPHVHIGAWKNEESVQIEFDLDLMGEQVKDLGELYYVTGYSEEEYIKIKEQNKKGK